MTHVLVPCLIPMDCIGHRCGVLHNDEWDHFEAFSTLASPFNAPSLERGIGRETDIHTMNKYLGSLPSGFTPK